MKKYGKLLLVLLSAMMLAALIPAAKAYAEEGGLEEPEIFDDSGTWGSLKYTFSGNKLTITGSGEMQEGEKAKDYPWYEFEYFYEVKEVVIGDNVTSIAPYAFEGYADVTKLTIGKRVKKIGAYALKNCTSLKALVIPDSVKTIEPQWFSTCSSLETLKIGSGMETIEEGLFAACKALKTVTIGPNVKTIKKAAFRDCTSMVSVNIPEGVTVIENDAFHFCDSLESVVIPDSVTKIESYAFTKCRSLKKLVIGSGVRSIGNYVFMQCRGLEEVTIKEGVEKLPDRMFYDCRSLKSITIPNSVTRIGSAAFAQCIQLESAVISDNVTSLGSGVFAYCSNLKNVVIGQNVTEIASGMFRLCTSLTDIPFGPGVTSIGSNAFTGCTSLTGSVVIPDKIKTIGAGAFSECPGITAVSMGSRTETIGGNAFAWCENLTCAWIPSSVTAIGAGVFCEDGKLTDIYYTGTTTDWVHIDIADQENECLRSAALHCNSVIAAPEMKALANTADSISVSWTAPAGAALFRLYRKPVGGSWERIAETKETSCNDTAAVVGTKYLYRVIAKAADKWSGVSNTLAAVRNPFTDVSEKISYFPKIAWAYNSDITKGTSPTTFSPMTACRRYQFAVMLYKLAGKPAVSGVTLPFEDVPASASYYNAVAWAYSSGIISGTSKTTFSPDDSITRYQAVQMLYKMAGKPEVSGVSNPFTDVKEGKSYYNAVMWAVGNGITSGTSAATFSPGDTCKRYQMVVFLYKFNQIYQYK